jgi:hypothetical protein
MINILYIFFMKRDINNYNLWDFGLQKNVPIFNFYGCILNLFNFYGCILNIFNFYGCILNLFNFYGFILNLFNFYGCILNLALT